MNNLNNTEQDPGSSEVTLNNEVLSENTNTIDEEVTDKNINSEVILNPKDCDNNENDNSKEIIEDSENIDKTDDNQIKSTDKNIEEEMHNISSGNANKSSSDVTVNRPAYIPPHLMGRDLNNPAQDMIGTGRRVQKPRLGVKVPYRNLTSQIVSQDEIAQEILERSLRKYSYTDVPEGGDVFFAMKLTHRLANKISSSNESTPEKTNETVTSRKLEYSEPVKIKNEMKKTEVPTVAEKVNDIEQQKRTELELIANSAHLEPSVNSAIEKKNANTLTESVSNFESKADQLYAEISSTLNEDCKITKPVKLNTPTSGVNSYNKNYNPKIVNGSISQTTETELDNDTLLAILEGTSDLNDSVNAVSTPKFDNNSKRKKRVKPVLDPNVEKELALKQLMDFETKRNREKLKRNMKKMKFGDQERTDNQQNNNEIENSVLNEKQNDISKPENAQKKIKRNSYSHSSAPRRFPKKYQRIIKRQLRSSKLKNKSISPEQQKKLPEVPEVKIAIDRFIKTYTNKRKHKPDTKPEKLIEKKTKEDQINKSQDEENVKHQEVQVEVVSGENCNDTDKIKEVTKENENSVVTKPKASSKVMREINRLLGDEGAINMIYSIEQKRLPDSKRDTNILPSLRRKKKDLLLKTKLVKNAVLRLSMSSSQVTPGRVRRSPEITKVNKTNKSPPRKASVESLESNNSAEHSPKIRKVAAEASRIIRRHSSSSSYSSDEEEIEKQSPEITKFNTQSRVEINSVSETPKRKISNTVSEFQPNNNEVLLVLESNNNECQIKEKYNEKDECNRDANLHANSMKLSKKDTKEGSKEENQRDSKIQRDSDETDISLGIPEQLSLKEITVRKYDNLVQIILISSSTKMKNALNILVLHELCSVLSELQKDDSCRTVLVTSTGSSFCQGIDLPVLICPDKVQRAKIVDDFITALITFTKLLSQFRKLLIAGVHGSAVGLGVTMLPFFDMVFASDKATFYTPYVKLGQIPEAGSTLTLPHLLGNAVTSELLFGCRMLTASEALQFGLVTRILWPDKFSEELIPLARGIASHSSQSMESTKFLLRQGMNSKLKKQLETEAELLRQHWCSDECQNRFQEFLQKEALLQNK